MSTSHHGYIAIEVCVRMVMRCAYSHHTLYLYEWRMVQVCLVVLECYHMSNK